MIQSLNVRAPPPSGACLTVGAPSFKAAQRIEPASCHLSDEAAGPECVPLTDGGFSAGCADSERPRILSVTLFSSRIAFSTLVTNSLNALSSVSDSYSPTRFSKPFFCERRYCSVPLQFWHWSL